MTQSVVRVEHVRDLPELAWMRKRKLEATSRLLGDTIAISERAWQEPSRLPGWTRAHVATHLARNADAFSRSIDAFLMGRRALMYDSTEDRIRALERGSERSALELQIDLDTSAGRLNVKLNQVDGVSSEPLIELSPGQFVAVRLLPVARLNEIVLHHVDLDCGFEITDIDDDIARWLLAWNMVRSNVRSVIRSAHVQTDSNFRGTIGVPGPTVPEVRGTDAEVLGWLTGRLRPEVAARLGLPDQTQII